MNKKTLRKSSCPLWILCALALILPALVGAQTANAPAADSKADPKSIPVVDGGIGPCTADFTITDTAGAPVYAATVKVHIAYGFMGARKLDLEVGTNAAGQARMPDCRRT